MSLFLLGIIFQRGVATAGFTLLLLILGGFFVSWLPPISYPWVDDAFFTMHYTRLGPGVMMLLGLMAAHYAFNSRKTALRLLEISRAKDLLMDTVAHEIRTPLGGIIGSLQMMQLCLERGGSVRLDELSGHLSLANVSQIDIVFFFLFLIIPSLFSIRQ